MASFSFGAASTPAFGASTPAFGAASTPAFGAPATGGFTAFGSAPAAQQPSSSAWGFGAASAAAPAAPLFGATPSATAPSMFGAAPASTPSLFGAASTPSLFGASSTPSMFGASSASMFGASSAPSLFGASSTPSLFGAASTPSMFGAASAPSMFGASSAPSMFGASSAPSMFGAAAGAMQVNAMQQPQPGLITYSTRYDDLPPDRQKELQDIQREISSYREDCEKLDRDPRLHGSQSTKSMEEETSSLKQSLQGMLSSIRADDEALADFREKVLKLLRSTEYAVRTFQRAKLWRDAPQQYKGQIVPPQVQELLASPVLLPSPYLEQAIQGFQQTLENYRQVISELEQALPSQLMASLGSLDESSLLQQLPLVISHMHDYFVHVAARMERLHQEVQRCKDAYISQQRALGNYSDPFEEQRRHQALASPRPDSGRLHTQSGPHHHYHHPAVVPSTPVAHVGAVQPESTFGAMHMPATPFGTPFGGPISPAAGDMSRSAGGRRRR